MSKRANLDASYVRGLSPRDRAFLLKVLKDDLREEEERIRASSNGFSQRQRR